MVKPGPNYDSKEMNIIVNHQKASVTETKPRAQPKPKLSHKGKARDKPV